MAYDARGYFSLSVWRDGRPVRIYFGKGAAAEREAVADAGRKAERARRAAEDGRAAEGLARLDASAEALCDAADARFRAEMTRAGCREWRGCWRRRKGGMIAEAKTDDVAGLNRKALAGDREARAALLALFAPDPEAEGRRDLSRDVLSLFAAGHVATEGGTAALLARLEALRRELEGPSPSPAERLLCEVAVRTHLLTLSADLHLSHAMLDGSTARRVSMLHEHAARAQRRLTQALRNLALIRKLARPEGKPNG